MQKVLIKIFNNTSRNACVCVCGCVGGVFVFASKGLTEPTCTAKFSLVLRPHPAFCHLQYGKVGE